MGPGIGETLCGRVSLVDDKEPGFLLFRVRFEITAHEVAVPLPVILAVGGGMDTDEAAAVSDIALQGFFFFWSEDLSGWAQENEGCVFAQDLWAKPGGVGCAIDGKIVKGPELADGADAGADAGMMVAIGLAEDKHFGLVEDFQRGAGGGAGEQEAAEEDSEKPDRPESKAEEFHRGKI